MCCKDCIHYDLCNSLDKNGTFYNFEFDGWDGKKCNFFKYNTTVPFMIGQPVWKLYTWRTISAEILEGRVSMIQQKADKSWKVRISNKYGTEDFKAGDIDKYYFLTKEAAEDALARFNKDRGNL